MHQDTRSSSYSSSPFHLLFLPVLLHLPLHFPGPLAWTKVAQPRLLWRVCYARLLTSTHIHTKKAHCPVQGTGTSRSGPGLKVCWLIKDKLRRGYKPPSTYSISANSYDLSEIYSDSDTNDSFLLICCSLAIGGTNVSS